MPAWLAPPVRPRGSQASLALPNPVEASFPVLPVTPACLLVSCYHALRTNPCRPAAPAPPITRFHACRVCPLHAHGSPALRQPPPCFSCTLLHRSACPPAPQLQRPPVVTTSHAPRGCNKPMDGLQTGVQRASSRCKQGAACLPKRCAHVLRRWTHRCGLVSPSSWVPLHLELLNGPCRCWPTANCLHLQQM